MPRNRVHELEATVEQLQGTIDGLTIELLEVNKRLRALEGDLDPAQMADTKETKAAQVKSPLESDGTDIIIC